MGDRWDRDELSDSRYMWLPLIVNGASATASLPWRDVWTIDVTTGEAQDRLLLGYSAEHCFLGRAIGVVGYPQGVSYEAETGTITGAAKAAACSGCSAGKFVTNGTVATLFISSSITETDTTTTQSHQTRR